MRLATVLGTRPEIIRLSRVIEKLDKVAQQTLIHTGQNFEPALSEIFFDELGVRQPDLRLNVRGATAGDQIGQILLGCEAAFMKQRPDRVLILGDTNSALSAIIAKRLGIPVLHMEAGNRCFDDRVPEEVNRRLIDHSSDILIPYTERSRANLLREGIASDRIYVTGNPILEVIEHYRPRIAASTIIADLGLSAGDYFLVTMHRAENVDVEARLASISHALGRLSELYACPVIVSTHPRTRIRMAEFGILAATGDVRFPDPFGLFDFIALEAKARCVLSDSGTVQEECAIFRIPNVTLRDVTERPETLECGSNILAGADADRIMACVATVLGQPRNWSPPPEYLVPAVSDTVVRLATSYYLFENGPRNR